MVRYKFPTGKGNPKFGKGHLVSGKNNPFYGKKHTEETKEKMKLNHVDFSGKNNPMYGRKGLDNPNLGQKRNKATKQLMSKASKKNWENPKYREKCLPNLFKNSKPTALEKSFMNLINKYNLPYKYVGNGTLFIGNRNPDFIHISDKKIIEVCNNFHHKEYYSDKRINYFKQYGYKTMVLWDVLFGYESLFGRDIVHEDIILDLLKRGDMI